MTPNNWKWNSFYYKWENIDRFQLIYISTSSEDGLTHVIAELPNGYIYYLAMFNSEKEAQEFLDKFME